MEKKLKVGFLDTVLELSDEAITVLKAHAQVEVTQPESGGILLGRRLTDSNRFIVDRVTSPCDGDQCERYLFHRKRKPHQKILDEAWSDSGGTVNYLGEWHTHAVEVPEPSWVDKLSWKKTSKRCPTEFGSLFFVIVGASEIRIWMISSHEKTLLRMDEV